MTPIKVPLDSKLRLLSYADGSGAPRLGIARTDGYVVDVAHAAGVAKMELGFDGTSMLALIEAGAEGLAKVRELAAAGTSAALKLQDIKLLPPLPKLTRNIVCVGWNYAEHFEESQRFRASTQAMPEHPVFFTKGTNTLNGPFDPIPYDALISAEIDWEVELAVVIGKRGRNIGEAEAAGYIFGYTAVNDTSARDIQKSWHGGQWFKGKSLDGHAPMGPWIVPASEIGHDNLQAYPARERRSEAGRQYQGYVFQGAAADRGAVARTDPRTGRRDHHRHAARRWHGPDAARIPEARRCDGNGDRGNRRDAQHDPGGLEPTAFDGIESGL